MTNTKNKDTKALKGAGAVFLKLVTNKKENKGKDAISVQHLSFSVKKRLLLNDLSFTVKAGEIHGFLGPNGAGKTTTIKNIIDAYTTRSPESKILIGGLPCESVEAKKKIAYIPEYAAFPTHLSLIDYLVTMAKFSGENKIEAKKKGDELVELLGLEQHKDINPNDFSSGMKKKVLLAQSLMTDPEILILDEPAANLDPSARAMLFKSLKDLSNQGIAIFISSHILAELEGLVDSLTLINNGNIMYTGSLKEIKSRFKEGGSHTIRVFGETEEINKVKKISKKKSTEVIDSPTYVKFTTTDKNELFKIISEIGKKKINISKIEFDEVSLQDIYDKEFS